MNLNFLSICFPIKDIAFPIVNAATTVPIPSPMILPVNTYVSSAVMARQIRSKEIFTFEYGTLVIVSSSLGKRSVGIIGSLHLFDTAIPNEINT